MVTFTFFNPEAFILVVPIIIVIFLRGKNQKDNAAKMLFPSLKAVDKKSPLNKPGVLLKITRLIALLLIIFAIARPVQIKEIKEVLPEKQVAIFLAIDVSKSMMAEDLQPNRLSALKSIATDFINKRPNDLIGLIVYAGESFAQCPATTDHELVKSLLADASAEWLADGTAIGLGLASAVNRIKSCTTESKIIVLLTDGENNAGSISPIEAARFALRYKIKVYTIGIGTEGMAPYPIVYSDGQKKKVLVPVSIDEPLLKEIATMTKGNYYRAKTNKDLESIYKKIDVLETQSPQINKYRSLTEHFYPFAFAALCMIFLEVVLKYTLLKSFT